MCTGLYSRDGIDRKEEGRGLAGIEDSVDALIRGVDDKIKNNKD